MRSWGSMLVFPGGKYDAKEDDHIASQLGLQKPSVVTALR